MRLFLFLFVLAPMAWASPATRDADLKAVQMNLSVGADGGYDITTYRGAITLSNGNLTSFGISVLENAASVHGNITSIYGVTLSGTGAPFTSVSLDPSSTAIADVNGLTGQNTGVGGAHGANSQLTEGGRLVSSGVINGGNGGNTDAPGSPGNGGDATVILDPAKTSWHNIVLNPGVPGADFGVGYYPGNGGNANLVLHSTQASAALNITDNTGIGAGYDAGNDGVSNITVTGTSLTVLTLTLHVTQGCFGTHDYSGAALNQASVDALLAAYAAQSYGAFTINPTLNCNGLCASPSSTGSDAAATIASYSIAVETN
jgi:hypothetical protein